MLKVDEVKDGRVRGLTCVGGEAEIALDIASIVEAIAHTLKRAAPGAEIAFRDAVTLVLSENSVAWKGMGELLGGHASVTTLEPQGRKRNKRKG